MGVTYVATLGRLTLKSFSKNVHSILASCQLLLNSHCETCAATTQTTVAVLIIWFLSTSQLHVLTLVMVSRNETCVTVSFFLTSTMWSW